MNRSDFEILRGLDGKYIDDDIEFRASPETGPNLSFDKIVIYNRIGYKIFLNGTYSPRIKKITYNFVLKGLGPICRVDVNGTFHKDKGRTHKHEVINEGDPQRNLPEAIARPDLEGKTPREVWKIICKEAKIEHRGEFKEPT